MKNAWKLMLILMLAMPVHAQADEAEDEEAPAEESIAPETVGNEPAAEDSIETTPVTEAAAETTETIPVEEPTEQESLENSDPLPVYVGLDLASTKLSVSGLGGFQARDYDSGMYRLRAGVHLLQQVRFEFQYGFDAGGDGPDEVSTKSYYGLFAVPTANLFDIFELAFPVGYAKSKVERPGASANLGSLAYGINAELPLRNFAKDWPDLRFGLGWMVYYQKSDARLYGANLGVRYDFTTASFGNPFAGLDLWPFGDDEEEALEEPAE